LSNVIIIHGKTPSTLTDSYRELITELEKNHNVYVPVFTWATDIKYKYTVEDSVQIIVDLIKDIQQKNNNVIYIVGHSMGAVALAYYEQFIKSDVKGIVLISPGHFVDKPGFINKYKTELDLCKKLQSEGRGDEQVQVRDWNGFEYSDYTTTPNLFLNWTDSDSNINFTNNCQQITTPILYITTDDKVDTMIGNNNKENYFDTIQSPDKEFVMTQATHRTVVGSSKDIILNWIKWFL